LLFAPIFYEKVKNEFFKSVSIKECNSYLFTCVFLCQISLMQSKLKGRTKEEEAKFAQIDSTLKRLDRKIREGSVLDPSGPRGANKVSAMAEQLAKMNEEPAATVQKSSSKSTFTMAQPSCNCHFCGKQVYLMERLSAEGVYFHRGCFRCEYCGTTLRQSKRMG
jgi:hypothetical protein